MMMNPKYLIYHDLIGLYTSAKQKSNKKSSTFTDLGLVIDETKNMLITEKNQQIKKYIKQNFIFRFKLPETNDELEVNGIKIIGRPENRLKYLKKKRRFRK